MSAMIESTEQQPQIECVREQKGERCPGQIVAILALD